MQIGMTLVHHLPPPILLSNWCNPDDQFCLLKAISNMEISIIWIWVICDDIDANWGGLGTAGLELMLRWCRGEGRGIQDTHITEIGHITNSSAGKCQIRWNRIWRFRVVKMLPDPLVWVSSFSSLWKNLNVYVSPSLGFPRFDNPKFPIFASVKDRNTGFLYFRRFCHQICTADIRNHQKETS